MDLFSEYSYTMNCIYQMKYTRHRYKTHKTSNYASTVQNALNNVSLINECRECGMVTIYPITNKIPDFKGRINCPRV